MKFTATIIPLEVKSKRGELVRTPVVEDYLKSEHYLEKLVNKKLSFLGITHKDRKLSDPTLKGIGADDQVLVNRNTIGVITRAYIEGDWVLCDVDIFDENNFEGSVREDILYLKGLLKGGSRPSVSAILDAYWTGKFECKQLLDIDGLDITLNPAFVGAEIKTVEM